MVKLLYRRILLTGLREYNFSTEEIKLTQRSNFLALIVLFFIIPFIFIFWRLGVPVQIISLLIIGLSCFLIFWLNSRQKFGFSRSLQIVLLGICLFYFGLIFGYASGAHYLFFVSLLMPFALFRRDQQNLAILVAGIYFLMFLALEMEWIVRDSILTSEGQLYLRRSVMILVFVWLFLSFLMFSYTNRQSEQQLLVYANKLEFKHKETEQMIYITSHDLQEPLRSISGFLKLLKEDEAPRLTEDGHMYLQHISEGVDRMHQLVLHLMDYTRLGENSTFFLVDINKLIKTVLADLKPVIEHYNAEIKISNLPVLNVDPTEIRVVFENLIENGIKFHREDEVPRLEIAARMKGEFWRFSVQDNGIGIEPRFHDKVFSIFKRLHHQDKYQGLGVGLAHCKKIVELHGGKIWVESLQQGTVFHFTLPARRN